MQAFNGRCQRWYMEGEEIEEEKQEDKQARDV